MATSLCLFMTSQGPRVSDEKLQEICSAVVEGSVCSLYFALMASSFLIFIKNVVVSFTVSDNIHLCLSRTTCGIYERVSKETSSHWCPWHYWTTRTSWTPGTSWGRRGSRTPWADGHQRPPGFLWTSWCTRQKRSDRFLKLWA